MKLSADASAFFLLSFNQLSGHVRQRLFRHFAFRNFYFNPNQPSRLTSLVHKDLPAPSYPTNTPVQQDHPPFTLRWFSAVHRGVNQLDDTCPIVGMNQIFKSRLCSVKGFGLQAMHRLQFRCPSVHTCLDIPLKTADVSDLLRQSQPLVTSAYCLFCLLFVRDVLNHRNPQRRWTTVQ